LICDFGFAIAFDRHAANSTASRQSTIANHMAQ